MDFESYVLDIINGKKKGIIPSIVKFFLFIVSFFFEAIVKLRNKAYDTGLFSKYRPPVPLVISIGNIVAGGTGKTPAVLFVAEAFYDEFKIAVLSRGYRSHAEKQPTPLFLCQGFGPMHPASFSGDEPYLIAENLPKAIVIVGRNRHDASNMAAKSGAELIILDDGMQQRQLARDFEIVLMDAEDPFGQGSFLPRGLLRESPQALSRADLIILNHVESEKQFLRLKTEVKEYSESLVIGSELKVQDIFDLKGNEIVSIKDKKVALFCAIAKPLKFKQTVLNEGGQISAEYFIPDHMPFDEDKLEKFANNCRVQGIEMLICTEKDKVKFPKNLNLSLPVVWIKVRLQIIYGQDDWNVFIQNLKKDIIRRI